LTALKKERAHKGTHDPARAAIGLAIPTATDDLAVVLRIEVCDFDVGAAVELDDLVAGVEGATAVDVTGTSVLL
jgi:hypothetical protein